MNLSGKTILITGASSGIGKALAVELSKEKVNLLLVARRVELLDEIKNLLLEKNCSIQILKCDVSKKEEVVKAYSEIKREFESIDLAILNAGTGAQMNILNYSSELAEKIYGTNLLGMIYWIEQLLPDFLKKRSGIIAGVSSLADNRGYSGSSFYSSSKAAVTNYLEGLRVELYHYGVKVITIRPGFVDTPMVSKNKYKMPFIMSADKAAKIILNGIKKEKSLIQFPWQMVLLTNLIGILPSWFYEPLVRHLYEK